MLSSLFAQYGPVEYVEVKNNYAFVKVRNIFNIDQFCTLKKYSNKFFNLENAIEAQKKVHGITVQDRTLSVEFSSRKIVPAASTIINPKPAYGSSSLSSGSSGSVPYSRSGKTIVNDLQEGYRMRAMTDGAQISPGASRDRLRYGAPDHHSFDPSSASGYPNRGTTTSPVMSHNQFVSNRSAPQYSRSADGQPLVSTLSTPEDMLTGFSGRGRDAASHSSFYNGSYPYAAPSATAPESRYAGQHQLGSPSRSAPRRNNQEWSPPPRHQPSSYGGIRGEHYSPGVPLAGRLVGTLSEPPERHYERADKGSSYTELNVPGSWHQDIAQSSGQYGEYERSYEPSSRSPSSAGHTRQFFS
jgi:hypothetical protein